LNNKILGTHNISSILDRTDWSYFSSTTLLEFIDAFCLLWFFKEYYSNRSLLEQLL